MSRNGGRFDKESTFPIQMGSAPVTDPLRSAKAARLHYVSDETPGIHRIRSGKNFRYVLPSGKPLLAKHALKRIRSLAIPPAWTDVWICPIENGHLQATGRDARGRKQYRYHPRWRAVRDQTKFGRMIDFAKALPEIRKRIAQDIELLGLPEEKVLASVVGLLEMTQIRVGNEEYVRQNHSFGLTTLRNHHVEVSGATMHFEFRGKRGIRHVVEARDRRLAAIVRRCQDLPGQDLFQYIDEQGVRHPIGSTQVNDYLRRITQQDFTAKDFRTWGATVLAALCLQECGSFTTQKDGKHKVLQALGLVAERLGNTVAICRKCYVHPGLVEAYLDGSLGSLGVHSVNGRRPSSGRLRPEERAVLRFLKRLKRSQKN